MSDARALLILASASPRRARLLAEAGIAFEARPVGADETPPPGASPRDAAILIARRKADAIRAPGAWVLAADTIVDLDGRILGKPADPDDARAILAALSGREHEVHTGVAVRDPGGAIVTGAASTRVRFRVMRSDEIAAYVETGEPMDKAGAYAVQGGARAFVAAIDGPLDNVIGLPMELARDLLTRSGYPAPR